MAMTISQNMSSAPGAPVTGAWPHTAPAPAPAPGAITAPVDLPLVPDTGTSVAGEEDPGAALDLTGDGAKAAPA